MAYRIPRIVCRDIGNIDPNQPTTSTNNNNSVNTPNNSNNNNNFNPYYATAAENELASTTVKVKEEPIVKIEENESEFSNFISDLYDAAAANHQNLPTSSSSTKKKRSQNYNNINRFLNGFQRTVVPAERKRRRRLNENELIDFDDDEVRIPRKRGRPPRSSYGIAAGFDGGSSSNGTTSETNINDQKRQRTRTRTTRGPILTYDCKIEGDERIFDVNKKLLSEKSVGFKTLFEANSDDLIEIEGVPDATLELVIKFCHTSSIKECSNKDTFSMLFFADVWEIDQLKKLLEARLVRNLAPSNVVIFANAATTAKSEIVRNACKDYMLKVMKDGCSVRNYSNLNEQLREELDELVSEDIINVQPDQQQQPK